MRVQRGILVVLLAALTCTAWAADPVFIFLGPDATEIEHHAAVELQRHVYAVSKRMFAIETVETLPEDVKGFVLGTKASLPKMPVAWPFDLEEPGADGYILHSEREDNKLIIIASSVPEGVQNGVYGILETFGFGFYLGQETFPEEIPDLTQYEVPSFNESVTPKFDVRGTLPWFGYLSGPSAWELADYKAYIDRLVRMRLNLVAFHAYDSDPFAAYEWKEKIEGGGPLANLSTATRGASPIAVDDFFGGTSTYFAEDYFGASPSRIVDPTAAIAKAKSVLREAMAYAKGRGMTVCMGFETKGNILDGDQAEQFAARLRQLLTDYPMIDHVWLWEPEAKALHPGADPAARSTWAAYTNRWGGAFEDVAEPRRKAEAVRMALFAIHGRQVLKAMRPDVGLVVSGWGGDSWLRCTDFYPGMDQILPKDITFSALDTLRVASTVSASYGKLSPERQRWPILWHEFDGDLWMPQPNLYETAGACRDAAEKGCQGLLGIHWRTRAADEAAAYCARFAWNPELTVEEFSERMALDLFGEELGETLAPYLLKLQGLGYRWVGGLGQQDSATFTWGPGDEEKRAELARIAADLRVALGDEKGLLLKDLIPDIVPIVPELVGGIVDEVKIDVTLGLADKIKDIVGAGSVRADRYARLQDLTDLISYVLAFDLAAQKLGPDGGLDDLIYDEKMDEAVQLVQDTKLAQAMHTYGRRIKNKGELGVLASINARAWADLRERLELSPDQMAALTALPEDLKLDPAIKVLPDRVIVMGLDEKEPKVRVKARMLGETKWVKHPLTPMGRNSFALSFPEEVMGQGNYEWGIEVITGMRTRLVWPGSFPAKPRTGTTLLASLPEPPAPPKAKSIQPVNPQFTILPDAYSVQLTWDTQAGEVYEVARDGKVLGMVFDGWFVDATPPSSKTVKYSITARNLRSGHKATRYLSVAIPELPLPEAPEEIQVATRGGRIILGWESSAPQAVQYSIVKYDQNDQVLSESTVAADYGHYLQFADPAEGMDVYSYAIAGVAPDGRVGPASKRIGAIPSKAPLKPMLRLAFDDEAFLEGLSQIAENALALGGSGWAELPPQAEWNPEDQLSISLWVKMEDLQGMPVLICKGAWQHSGYFVQIYREQIRFYIAGVGTLDAGYPEAGKWQHIGASYGSGEMSVYLDGKLVGHKRVAGRPRPSSNPLLVGRYGLTEDVYFVRGLMDEIQIFNAALTETEIREIAEATKPK